MGIPASAELFYGYKLTDEQKEFVDSIFDNQFTIVNAKAGTGKTTLAVGAAKILEKHLLYTFNPVEEDKIGFTPGDDEVKEEKYLGPLIDALKEIKEDPRLSIYRKTNPDFINKETWITAQSHIFKRGTNFKNMTVIIDEAQNLTKKDLKKILTRVHNDTKVIMIGHDGQCDLEDASKSGFVPYLEWFRNEPYTKICHLTKNFRGPLAQHADLLE